MNQLLRMVSDDRSMSSLMIAAGTLPAPRSAAEQEADLDARIALRIAAAQSYLHRNIETAAARAALHIQVAAERARLTIHRKEINRA